MNPTFFLFLVIGIVYYALARQISVTQRSLSHIEDKLKSLCATEDLQEGVRTLSGELRKLGKEISSDIKHEIEMHEVRTS